MLSARHFEIVIKAALSMTSLGLVVLWPEWRVAVQAENYPCLEECELGCLCKKDNECRPGWHCEDLFSEGTFCPRVRIASGCQLDEPQPPPPPPPPPPPEPPPPPPEPPPPPPPPPPEPPPPPPPPEPPPPPPPEPPPPPPPPPPEPPPPDPKNEGGHSTDTNQPVEQGIFEGDPINITTGNVVQIETDYIGAGPFPLVLRRTYNSRPASAAPFAGPFGANWSHSYSAHIQQVSSTSVQVVRADQKTLTFTLQDDRWGSSPDTNSTLASLTEPNGEVIAWIYTTGSDDVEIYDGDGKLRSITTRSGLTQILGYDQGRLKSVTDPFGRTLTFDYQGDMIRITDPAEGTYTYEVTDNLESVTGPDGKTRHYHYEKRAFPHALTGMTDENNVRFATFDYYSDGRAMSSERAGGVNKVEVKYKGSECASDTCVTDALGTERSYSYVTIFDVKRTEIAAKPSPIRGTTTSAWAYDGRGNARFNSDYRGNRTQSSYNARNLEVSRTEALEEPEQRTITTIWHDKFRLPEEITEPNRVTTFVYDPDGKDGEESYTVKDTVTGRSRTWAFHYRNDGQIERIDGPRTDVEDITRYAYDDKGRLKSRTDLVSRSDAPGQTREITTEITAYDAHGRPREIKDPNGLITSLTYDARGRLKSHQAGGELTTYEYDGVGQLCKLRHPDGSFFAFTYDEAQRLIAITDNRDAPCLSSSPPAQENAIIYTLDKVGNPVEEQVYDRDGMLARTHCRTVDPLNRLKSSGSAVPETGLCPSEGGDNAPTTKFEYDDNDNLIQLTDPLGHSTTPPWSYDALDRLQRSTDLNGGQTVYSFDANDRLETVTDPEKLQTIYDYDGLDNLIRSTSPDTGVTKYVPDEAGNTSARKDARKQKTTYIYDELNRVTDIEFSDGAVKFVYDQETDDIGQRTNGIGRLTQMRDATGTTTHWSYDPLGRVVRKTQQFAGLNRPLITQYGYENGRLTSMTYPSGQRIKLDYTDGQVTEISIEGRPLLSNIEYDPFGPARAWDWGTTPISTYTREFNLDGQVKTYDLGQGRARELMYDDAGRIERYFDTDPSRNQSFDYEDAGAVREFTSNGVTTILELDDNGNRTRLSSAQESNVYIQDRDNHGLFTNQLLSITGTHAKSYKYDDAGNVISDGVNEYKYDGRGRLILVTNQDGSTQYLINGLGQRVAKLDCVDPSKADCGEGPRTGSYFVHDEAGRLLGEYDHRGVVVQEFVYIDDMPVAVLMRGGRFFIYPDHLGTPRAIVDESGNVIWRWESDPFGVGSPDEDPDGNGRPFTFNLRFPGQYFDEETKVFDPDLERSGHTGLFHNYFRDYDPQTGRYIQADPIGLEGGINPYLYAEGNPLTFIDPYGLGPLNGGPYTAGSAGAEGGPVINPATGQPFLFAELPPPRGGPAAIGWYQQRVAQDFLQDWRPTPSEQVAIWMFGGAVAAGGALSVGYVVAAVPIVGPIISGAMARATAAVAGRAAVAAPGAATIVAMANRLHHIFGQPRHNLGVLLGQFGGNQAAAFRAVEVATQRALSMSGTTGVFQTTVTVAGETLIVRGNIVNGVVRIGTFFKP